MKVIFLDFDGVLNCDSTTDRVPHPVDSSRRVMGLDADKVKLVSSLAEKTGSDIVISSTWREFYSISQLTSLLRSRGLSADIKILGATPVSSHTKMSQSTMQQGSERGNEISSWLASHQDVVKYLVIDDLPISQHKTNQVQTDDFVGFEASDLLRAYEILSGR